MKSFARKLMGSLSIVAFSATLTLSADNPVAGALVPGADLLMRLDVAKLMQSPVVKALEAASEEGNAGEADDPMEKMMETHLGLTKDDFVAFVGSVVTAPLYALEGGAEPDWSTIPVAATVTLAKPVTLAQLKAFLDAAKEEAGEGGYEVRKIAGRDVVILSNEMSSQPPLYITLSDSGQAAYLAMSQAGMDALLKRVTGATPATLSPALAKLRSTLPQGMQLAYLYQAPDALRQKIKEGSAQAAAASGANMNPAANIGIGLLKMFENLQSVGLGIGATQAFKIHLGADLGAAPQAQQASMMLKNMLIPMLQMQLAGMAKPGEAPIDANSLVSVNNAGSMLTLSLSVDQPMIENLQGMLMGAMMGGMMGGGEMEFEMESDVSTDEELVF